MIRNIFETFRSDPQLLVPHDPNEVALLRPLTQNAPTQFELALLVSDRPGQFPVPTDQPSEFGRGLDTRFTARGNVRAVQGCGSEDARKGYVQDWLKNPMGLGEGVSEEIRVIKKGSCLPFLITRTAYYPQLRYG